MKKIFSLSDIANHFQISKKELLEKLFYFKPGFLPHRRDPEISGVSRAFFVHSSKGMPAADSNGGTKDKITVRLYNQFYHAPVSCLGLE